MATVSGFNSAAERWAGLGPYYAMFPSRFANRVVRDHTEEGDVVIDPFAGRGTAVFSAATQRRTAIGVEISPVGYVYAKTKVAPADIDAVTDRIECMGRFAAHRRYVTSARELPPFFHVCFSRQVRRFLCAARAELDWRRSAVDRTAMAIMLVYLHGKAGAALSNQMRQTKAMAPDYAMRWWIERELVPPEIDPVGFLLSRLNWRYAKGVPERGASTVYFGDSVRVLPRVAVQVARGVVPRARLLFTSPPYYRVTNYHYDQWLRLWLLGGPPHARRSGNGPRGKFEHRGRYRDLLYDVFSRAKPLLRRDATVYVRTDARAFTRETTKDVLTAVFPSRRMVVRRRPLAGSSQTQLFGDFERTSGEVDLILQA